MSNDAKYGDGTEQEAIIRVSDVLYYDRINLKDIFFKNETGGSNCKIVAVGAVPTKFVDEALK